MAVVTAVLRRLAVRATPVAPAERLALWLLVALDAGVTAWMVSAGEWLDRTSAVTAVATLGGHHALVLGLALGGLALLVLAAVATGGFHRADPVGRGVAAAGGAVSLIAAGGVLSAVVVAVLVVLAVGVVGRAVGR